jgi:hypothetical protein
VLDAAQDFSPIIPEIAHRHRVHMASVSPVRQQRERHSRTNSGREYAAVIYARGTAWLFLLDGFGLTDYVVEGNGRAECSSRARLPASTVAATTVARPSQSPLITLAGPSTWSPSSSSKTTPPRPAWPPPLTDDNLSDTATR